MEAQVGARAEARAAAEMVGEMVEVRVGAMGVERVRISLLVSSFS